MNTDMKELNLNEMEKAAGGGGNNQSAVPGAKGIYKFIKRVISWFS